MPASSLVVSSRARRGALCPVIALVASLLSVGCGGASYDYPKSSPASYGGLAGEVDMAPMAPGAPMDFDGDDMDTEVVSEMRNERIAMGPPPSPAQAPARPAPQQQPGASGGADVERPAARQMLVYRAEFQLAVFQVTDAADRIVDEAKSLGGFLARRDQHAVTVRVPAERFEALVAAVERLGDVLDRNIVVEDVTAEFRDLDIQLKNLSALRERLASLLEKAHKVEDAIAIERELGRVTGEIERIKGRLRFLSDQVSLSTVTVRFAAKQPQLPDSGPFHLPLPWLSRLGLDRLLSL